MQRNTQRHGIIFWLAVFLLPALLLWTGGCENSHGKQQAAPARVPEVGTVTMEPRSVELTTVLPGRTSAYGVAEIRPQVDGIIQKRLFEEGSRVEAGQLLYQIDPAPFRVALNSAKASLAKARAGVPALRSTADRYRGLLAQHAVSQQDYDNAQAALDQGLAEIEYWKSRIDKSRIDLKYTQITAPISGRISRSRITDGALVKAYQTGPLATIQQMDPMYVDVTQSTSELLKLRRSLKEGRICDQDEKGKKVRILLEDGSLYPLEGQLQFRDVTSVDPATGSYILRIEVPNPEGLLLPGMYVRAVIQEGTVDQAILAPQEGVTRNPKGEAIALIVDDAGVVQQKMLKIDRAIGNDWLVTVGLSAGDRVIVEGRLSVRPGQQANVVSIGKEPDEQKNESSSPNENPTSEEATK
ncbi:MAG: efflux RND transporter periplasmic adaptor subunit [Desulfobacteraceae bacterium]|jgi:membrane fusion protein (multidrug efflux system)